VKGDVLFKCDNYHGFVVSDADMRIGVDGMNCIECGERCYPMGLAEWYPLAGLKRYTRSKVKDPLLTISVYDLNSVPVVTYKGKEIEGKISISYDWLTRSVGEDGGHSICIKHCTNDHGAPSVDTITLNRWDNPPSI